MTFSEQLIQGFTQTDVNVTGGTTNTFAGSLGTYTLNLVPDAEGARAAGLAVGEELRRAVAEDDVAALCLVPGVGKKTAARLVMELKSKLDLPEGEIAVPSGDGGQASAGGDSRADVRTALEGLGYGADEIHAVLVDLPAEGDVGGLLKDALRRLASGV